MISSRGRVLVWIACGALILWVAASAEAVYIDAEQTLKVTGKAQTRASIRLQDSEGFTYPRNVYVGNLVQWRNLALIEVDHDLQDLTDELDILYPLKALKIRSKYHIVGRFMYEAVYDVGPQAFRDVRDADKENIDNFKQSYDLWECYVDLSRGPVFFRIRQAEPGLGRDGRVSAPGQHQPAGQHLRWPLRGSGRPEDPAVDAPGQLQLRQPGTGSSR